MYRRARRHRARPSGRRFAAGTGKLTRLLVPSGGDVDHGGAGGWRSARRAAARRARCRGCSMEQPEAIPMPDESVADGHGGSSVPLVRPGSRAPRDARGLEPGGCLVLTWNTRDRNQAWVREFGELLVDGDLERPYDSYYEVDSRGGCSRVPVDTRPSNCSHGRLGAALQPRATGRARRIGQCRRCVAR